MVKYGGFLKCLFYLFLVFLIFRTLIRASKYKETSIVCKEKRKKIIESFDYSDLSETYYVYNPLVLIIYEMEFVDQSTFLMQKEIFLFNDFFARCCMYDLKMFSYKKNKKTLNDFMTTQCNELHKGKYDALILVMLKFCDNYNKENSIAYFSNDQTDYTDFFLNIKSFFADIEVPKFFFNVCAIQSYYVLPKSIKKQMTFNSTVEFISDVFTFTHTSFLGGVKDSCDEIVVVNCLFAASFYDKVNLSSFANKLVKLRCKNYTSLHRYISFQNNFSVYNLKKANTSGHIKSIRLFLGLRNGILSRYSYFLEAHKLVNDRWISIAFYFKNCHDINMFDMNGKTALHLAVMYGRLDIAKYLIKKCNANVNYTKYGTTALHLAARWGYVDIVSYLIKVCGADVDARSELQETALHLAAKHGVLDVVHCLVKGCGAQVNLKDKHGGSALHYAASNGFLNVVKCLVRTKNIQVNAVNNRGMTPLYCAASCGQLNIIRLLVQEGRAKIDIKDKNGCTALYVAKSSGYRHIVSFLLNYISLRKNPLKGTFDLHNP